VVVASLFPGAAAGDEPDGEYGRQVSRSSVSCPAEDPGCEPDTEVEPHVAVNPGDPANAVAAFQQGRYPGSAAAAVAYATTTDGGEHWAGGPLSGLTVATTGGPPAADGPPWARASDPVVAFDVRHGTVLVVTLGVTPRVPCPSLLLCTEAARGIAVSRSSDGGRTFEPPVALETSEFNDKPWIAVDNAAGSRFYGRAYVMWIGASIMFSTSDDGGVTWSAPTAVGRDGVPLPVVTRDGTVVVIYRGGINATCCPFYAISSRDGGDTWSSPVLLGRAAGQQGQLAARVPNLQTAAADPATGAVLVAWRDILPRATVNDIIFTRSMDGGTTWDPPRPVTTDDPPDTDHFLPALAAEDGRVYLTYHAGHTGHAALIDTVARISPDGGATFAAPRRLNANPSVAVFAAYTNEGIFLGDYMGVSVAGGRAYAVWAQAEPFEDSSLVDGTAHQRTFAAVL
jgi:hypothetical protein